MPNCIATCLSCKTLLLSDPLSLSSLGRTDFIFTLMNYFIWEAKLWCWSLIKHLCLADFFFFFKNGETLFSNYSLILWNGWSGSDDRQVVAKEGRDVVQSKLFILLWEKHVIVILRVKYIKPQEIVYQTRSQTAGFYPELGSQKVTEAGGMTWRFLSCLFIVKAELYTAYLEPPFAGCLFQELQRYVYNLAFWLLEKVRPEHRTRCHLLNLALLGVTRAQMGAAPNHCVTRTEE